MNEAMEPIHPAFAALLMGKRPEPCEPFVEISSKALTRLLDVVEFGDQLERVEKDNILSSMKELLAMEQPELWVLHSVGPGELHPMISKEAAESQAAELAEMFKEHVGKLGIRFDVIRSPFTPLEHFEILAEEVTEHRDNLLQHCKALEKKLAERPVIKAEVVMPDRLDDKYKEYFEDVEGDSFNYALYLRDVEAAIEAAGMQAVQPAPAVVNQRFSPAAIDVLLERKRQVDKEGWTPEHDDEHDSGELAAAAAAYAMHAADHLNPYSQGDGGDEAPICWPWHDGIAGRGEGPEKTKPAWWKPGAPRRNLIKAGALILAELERLDRAEQAKQQEQQL